MPTNPFEPPTEVNEPARVGCAPKLGCGLLALGSLLLMMTSRIAWLRWGSMDAHGETWNRVVVGSTIGAIFVIIGASLAVLLRRRT